MNADDLNPYSEGEPLWHVWRAEAGVGHYPTPADLPHPPGSPEGREWTRALLHWQTSSRNPNLEAEALRVDAERRAVWARHALTPAQLDVARTVRDVELATAPPRRTLTVVRYRDGKPTATVYDVDELWAQSLAACQPLLDAFAALADAFTQAWPAFSAALGQLVVPRSRHARGRQRRPPALSVGQCHHRNPANACRDCSTQRGSHDRNDPGRSRPGGLGAARSGRAARPATTRTNRRRQR